MKEKILGLIVVAVMALMFTACDMATGDTETSSNNITNNTSSILSSNIPENNSNGSYDTSSNSSNGISSFVSSEKDMINSMVK